jgi:hypothetical protein
MTHHVFTCWVGRVGAKVSTPIDVTTGARGWSEHTYDSSKRPQGRLLVPLPSLLFLASFNFIVKERLEASNLLAEGDAWRKQTRFKVAIEQERSMCQCYRLVLWLGYTIYFCDQWNVSNIIINEAKWALLFYYELLHEANLFFSFSITRKLLWFTCL